MKPINKVLAALGLVLVAILLVWVWLFMICGSAKGAEYCSDPKNLLEWVLPNWNYFNEIGGTSIAEQMESELQQDFVPQFSEYLFAEYCEEDEVWTATGNPLLWENVEINFERLGGNPVFVLADKERNVPELNVILIENSAMQILGTKVGGIPAVLEIQNCGGKLKLYYLDPTKKLGPKSEPQPSTKG